MKALLWTARTRVRALGWSFVLGIALVIAAIAAQLLFVRPLEEQVYQTRLADRHSRQQLRELISPAAREPAQQAEQLGAFYRYFKTDATLTDVLAILTAIASAQGLGMPKGEYRLLRDQTLKLAGYKITLPLSGSYPRVRAFVSLALARVPNLALDQVSYQRKRGPGAEVEAQIQFTYHFAEE